jgi:signal peptidase I
MNTSMAPCTDSSRAELVVDGLGRFGEARLRVVGSSMLPSLWPGDVLTVRPRLIAEVRHGDVAVFVRDDRLIAHRVIAHRGSHVVTQGDTVTSPDAPVSQAELIGIAVRLVRCGKARRVSSHVGLPSRLMAALVNRSWHVNRILQRVHAWRSLWALGSGL